MTNTLIGMGVQIDFSPVTQSLDKVRVPQIYWSRAITLKLKCYVLLHARCCNVLSLCLSHEQWNTESIMKEFAASVSNTWLYDMDIKQNQFYINDGREWVNVTRIVLRERDHLKAYKESDLSALVFGTIMVEENPTGDEDVIIY